MERRIRTKKKKVAGGSGGMKKEKVKERERPRLSEVTPCEFEFIMDTLTASSKEQLYILEQREATFSSIKFMVEQLKINNYLEPHEFDEYIAKWSPMLKKMKTLYEEGLAIGKAWDDHSTRGPPTQHSYIELKLHHSMSKIYNIPGQPEEIDHCLRFTEAYLKERGEIEKSACEFDKQEYQMSKDIESDKDLSPLQLKKRMDEVVELMKTMQLAKDASDEEKDGRNCQSV